jgi:hypothetical protein
MARRADGRPPWIVLIPLASVAAVVLLIVAMVGSSLLGASANPVGSNPPAGVAAATATVPAGTGDGGPSSAPADASSPTPAGDQDTAGSRAPSEAPSEAPQVVADVAIVPVTGFRSGQTAVRSADVRAIATGTGDSYRSLVLVKADAAGILAALDQQPADIAAHLVTVRDATTLAARLAAHPRWLGFLRADEVDASLRALAWGSKALFGVDRVRSLAAWPLQARLVVADGSAPTYNPKTAWTLVAGGDILLDRGVSLAIDGSRAGTDYPFDGGTAEITGVCKNCSPFGWDTPYTRRTGNAGAVRDLVSGADLAIANFENPAPNSWRFHDHGTIFSANPRNIAVLQSAGIDWVSMANNHIGDAGRTGILQTEANLDKHGIRHSGAGADTAEAHTAALIKVGDVTVGMLGYDTIAAYYQSGTDTPGSARMTVKALKRDIRAARKAGADVVIVFPHWGIEYQATPTAVQEKLGRAAIDAGADMVIGNHPHWVGAMEVYKGKPIWYALGNFVFDQTWSIPTMEGITLELTFDGTRLVQAHIRPHLILGKAQPNFLDPLGDGKAVMKQMFGASAGLLPW